ncbi:MAG TPA: nuclear transport factor 2 family protein [Longimicrobium sp.]|nr:nuclear transport factor 2 family protein [Longimicrobium sp.]
MGSSYSNITLHGPDRDRVIQALEARGRQAYVGPVTNGCVVVFDELSEDDPDLGAELAAELSRELGGAALSAMIHDEDIFIFSLARAGQVVDEYNSCPGYFEGDDTPPTGGNAQLLADVFGSGDAGTVERILRAPAKQGAYFLETARHRDFAEALGLPDHAVGLGFGYIYQGEADELEPELARVGFDDDEETGAPGNQTELMRTRLARSGMGQEALAAIDAMHAAAQSPAHGYFRALAAGDAAAIRALFAGEPVLDDPLSGRVDAAGLEAHVAAAQKLFTGATVHYGPAGLVETPERVVSHGQLVGRGQGGALVLPCACVWERAADGGLRELRAYWSPAAVKEQRGERAPILPPRDDLALPDAVARHLRALAADDVEGVTATYDATCLSPIPLPWLDPADTVRRHYGAQVGNEGAVVLQPCTVTQTDAACVIEFVTPKWDGADIPPQAGLAVYDLRGGGICQAHLFGDLAPSPMAGLGALGGMMGGMPGAGDPGAAGFGDLGAMGAMAGLGDLGALGAGGPGGMEMSPEAMQEAMEEVMKMMSGPGGLAGMMENLQKMMGGLGGLGGMPPIGGAAGLDGMDFGAFAGFPGMGAAGWDDDAADDADADGPDAEVDETDADGAGPGDAQAGGADADGADAGGADASGKDEGSAPGNPSEGGGADPSGAAPK